MLLAGDEVGRTQRGNNNAYCQDNELSWIDWNRSAEQEDLLAFTRYLIHIFRAQPVLKRRRFFQGASLDGGPDKDITWFDQSGLEMAGERWQTARCLGVRLDGTQLQENDEAGNPLVGDTLFLIFNTGAEPVRFELPPSMPSEAWERMLDTSKRDWDRRARPDSNAYDLAPRSVAAFRLALPFEDDRP
jgi:glycogen operon protein